MIARDEVIQCIKKELELRGVADKEQVTLDLRQLLPELKLAMVDALLLHTVAIRRKLPECLGSTVVHYEVSIANALNESVPLSLTKKRLLTLLSFTALKLRTYTKQSYPPPHLFFLFESSQVSIAC